MRLIAVPLVLSIMVVGLGLTLLTIVVRSPYTHTNLDPRYDPGYGRTASIAVGSPVPYRGIGLAVPVSASTNPVTRGQELFAADGCATCHGVDGRGGPVAPSIAGFDASQLRAKTTEGPGGMPAFDHQALPDADLAAIAAYLKSERK